MNINFFCFQPILFSEKKFFICTIEQFYSYNQLGKKIDNAYKNEKCCGIIDYLKFIERHELYLLNDFEDTVDFSFKTLHTLDFLEVDTTKTSYCIFFTIKIIKSFLLSIKSHLI